MYDIIMDLAATEVYADAEAMCRAPTVFKAYSDGYERWRRFAEESGRGELWVDWSEDETCEQRDVEEDMVSPTWDVKWSQTLCLE